jgi:glutaminyl-peptide cyclotransferase
MSDGSATLRFLDPESFTEGRRVVVKAAGVPVANLNELELTGKPWPRLFQIELRRRP